MPLVQTMMHLFHITRSLLHFRIVSLLLAILTLALVSPGRAPAAVSGSDVASEPAMSKTGKLAQGEWLAVPIKVHAEANYVVQLQPKQADADIYLQLGKELVAKSVNHGTAQEEFTWKAPRDAEGSLLIYGYGGATDYVLTLKEDLPRSTSTLAARTGRSSKIALQVGHWKNHERPPQFRGQTGTSWGNLTEPGVNLIITQQVAELLRQAGHQVELLPAVIPDGYRADLVVAIHSDGGPTSRRGFFSDRSIHSRVAAQADRLVKALNEEYARETGIPYVYRGTPGTKQYYGYYDVDPATPMALIEDGFLTNAEDRKIIVDDPARAARGIFKGIQRYLSE